jgi:tight adherence protein C
VILVGPYIGSAIGVGAFFAPVVRHRAVVARTSMQRQVAVPELVDLFRLAVGAGLSVHQVVTVVVPHAPSAFGPALDDVQRRVSLGARLGDALDALDELGEPIRPLVAALRAAAFDGVALGPALDRVAADARVQRRRAAEISARRLPVQLLFPLVLCVLPAFGLLAVVPLVVAAVGALRF